MQDSKVPTLSIGPRKPKVFGKPNQSPQLTLTVQKSPSSVNKSPSVTPQKAKTTMPSEIHNSANSSSSKKQNDLKTEASFTNEENNNSQKSTPSRRKDSKDSFHSEKDRASVISVSSAKKSLSSSKQRSAKVNNSKQDSEQSLESVSRDISEFGSEQPTTPVKTGKSELNGKTDPVRSSSSVKKQQQLSLTNSPTNSKSSLQQTTPTSKKATVVSSAKPNSKSNINANQNPRASTPNTNINVKNNQKQNKKENTNSKKTVSTEDESYDYSPTNSSKRQSKSPIKKKLPTSPVVKDIIPLVKTLLESHSDEKDSNDNNNDSKETNIIDEGKFSVGAESLEEWQKNIVSKASPLEESQIQLWYDSLIEIFKQQNFYIVEKSESGNDNTEKDNSSQNTPEISYLNEIIAKSRDDLRNHRFTLHGGYRHRFKFIVTGPNRSGKSTYLSILSQQLLYELIACGDWKKTFIFAINFSNIAHICQDLGQLFIEMARLSIQALCAQRPLLIKYNQSLIESFTAVVNGKPSIPRTFQLDEDFRLIAPQLQNLLDICYECYHDSQAMTSFTANACMLPFFIANVFGGFSNVVIIADHFDLSDVTKTASQPFEDSPDNVFVAEIYKYLFMQTSFIIGAKYESALNEVLTSLDVQNSSFAQGIEFLTTYNIIKKKKPKQDNKNEEEKENEKEENNNELEFNVIFKESNDSLKITRDDFEGCPLYLSKFDIVCDVARRIEKGNKLEDQKLSPNRSENNNNDNEPEEEIDIEEEKLKLVIKMEDLLKSTMLSQDGSQYNLHTKEVKFTHKESKQKTNG